jgi:hypothetical protein
MDSVAVASLRTELNHVLGPDGIRVRVVQVTDHELRLVASRVNGAAVLQMVQVSLGGAEPPASLVARVAHAIRDAFAHH